MPDRLNTLQTGHLSAASPYDAQLSALGDGSHELAGLQLLGDLPGHLDRVSWPDVLAAGEALFVASRDGVAGTSQWTPWSSASTPAQTGAGTAFAIGPPDTASLTAGQSTKALARAGYLRGLVPAGAAVYEVQARLAEANAPGLSRSASVSTPLGTGPSQTGTPGGATTLPFASGPMTDRAGIEAGGLAAALNVSYPAGGAQQTAPTIADGGPALPQGATVSTDWSLAIADDLRGYRSGTDLAEVDATSSVPVGDGTGTTTNFHGGVTGQTAWVQERTFRIASSRGATQGGVPFYVQARLAGKFTVVVTWVGSGPPPATVTLAIQSRAASYYEDPATTTRAGDNGYGDPDGVLSSPDGLVQMPTSFAGRTGGRTVVVPVVGGVATLDVPVSSTGRKTLASPAQGQIFSTWAEVVLGASPIQTQAPLAYSGTVEMRARYGTGGTGAGSATVRRTVLRRRAAVRIDVPAGELLNLAQGYDGAPCLRFLVPDDDRTLALSAKIEVPPGAEPALWFVGLASGAPLTRTGLAAVDAIGFLGGALVGGIKAVVSRGGAAILADLGPTPAGPVALGLRAVKGPSRIEFLFGEARLLHPTLLVPTLPLALALGAVAPAASPARLDLLRLFAGQNAEAPNVR